MSSEPTAIDRAQAALDQMDEALAKARGHAERILNAQSGPTEPAPTSWARVEIFGHRRHYGRISEIERFGAKMMQVEIPVEGKIDGRWETILYAGGSIFSLSSSTQENVLAHNTPYVSAR